MASKTLPLSGGRGRPEKPGGITTKLVYATQTLMATIASLTASEQADRPDEFKGVKRSCNRSVLSAP